MAKTAATGAQGSTDSAGTGQAQGTGTTGAQSDSTKNGQQGDQPKTEADATKTPATGQGGGQQASGTQGSTDGDTPKAPDKYTLTLPTGGRVDADDVTRIEAMARQNAWTNADAQAALDEYDAQIAGQATAFLNTTKADQDYGGEKLADTQRLARLAIDKIRPEGHARRDSFLRLLNRGGVGNHIEVLSFLADLGKRMGEDTAQPGSASGSGKKRASEMTQEEGAATLYDHPTSIALDQRQKAAR